MLRRSTRIPAQVPLGQKEEEERDSGKENVNPGQEEAIDLPMEKSDKEEKKDEKIEKMDDKTVAVKDPVKKEASADATVPTAASNGVQRTEDEAVAAPEVPQPKPEPYEYIEESVHYAQILDYNDWGGECYCADGECGVGCMLRYMSVECGKKCPSGRKCTNKAIQKGQCAPVEVFHTGTIKGFGVRAVEDIKKGRFIIEYKGEVMTEAAGEKRKKEYAREVPPRRHHYLMKVTDWKNKPFIIDATRKGNESRFFNHSCEPNTACDKFSVKKRFRMGFVAIKNITAGTELTFDYKFENYGRTVLDCMCGAAKCRKFMSNKVQAREEEERRKQENSEGSSEGEEDEEDEEEEEEEDSVEEELVIEEKDRKKLRSQQSIEEYAEQLIAKGVITNKKKIELMSVLMIRLTPAQQSTRAKLVKLLTKSGEKDNEMYRVFLERNGRMILQKYLTLGIDEDTTVEQYRELIPLLESMIVLLESIKQYTDTIRETSKMSYLVPILREIARTEVPDRLVAFDILNGLVSEVSLGWKLKETEDEWTKRWNECASRASKLAEDWKAASLITSFKIPKKLKKKTSPVKELSMLRTAALSKSIINDAKNAGWQSSLRKEHSNFMDKAHSKNGFANNRSAGEYKRTFDDKKLTKAELELKRERWMAKYAKKEENSNDEERSVENSSTADSQEEGEEDMQISPYYEESELENEPEPAHASENHHQFYNGQQGVESNGHPHQEGEWAMREGQWVWCPKEVPAHLIQGVPFTSLGPAVGSSLKAELEFYQKAAQYCAQRAEAARQVLQMQQPQQLMLLQQQGLQPVQPTAAAAVPPKQPPMPAEERKEEKLPQKPLDDRLTEISETARTNKKSEFKSKAVNVLKREIKASMFSDLAKFENILRKMTRGCIEKEEKLDAEFDFDFTDSIKKRIAKFAREYVERHKLKPLQ